MLKIGQDWGKIANYPPQMLNKDLHHWLDFYGLHLYLAGRCCENL